MKKDQILSLKQEIEELLSSRDMAQATSTLKSISVEHIPEALRAEFANLARRLNMPKLALKILWKQIHEKNSKKKADHYEYANCLRKIGLNHEALRILSQLEADPEVQLVKAFCYMSQWNYFAALKEIEGALSMEDQIEHSRLLVFQVNKIACLVEIGEVKSAQLLIESLLLNHLI